MALKLPFKTAALGKMLFLVLLVLLNAALFSRLMWGSGSIHSWYALKEKQNEVSQELTALNEQRAALSREIRLLKTDPDYVEKVIRQRLNYVRKNEILYLFDKNRQDSRAEKGKESRP
ncbi:MAG: septum formation initiator family protein [Mailhella sp.]|nr:septum formation initiator family protein [Mailhella sp.]